MKSLPMRYLRDGSGGTAIEYGLIVTLISATILGGLTAAGVTVRGLFDSTAAAMNF